MNKLNYDPGASADSKSGVNWNQRPRDASQVTKFIGVQIERKLNWQIVNLQAPVDELHDAPILYISGNKPLTFDQAEKEKLRAYIEEIRGGIAQVLETDAASVSVKAKTGEGVDAVGLRQAVRAMAVVLIRKVE